MGMDASSVHITNTPASHKRCGIRTVDHWLSSESLVQKRPTRIEMIGLHLFVSCMVWDIDSQRHVVQKN